MSTDLRPLLTPALEAVLLQLGREPELVGIDTHRIVVVAGAAHGTAVASVRPLAGCARSCRVSGRVRAVELCLRPPFFLHGTPSRRLATLVHELLHLDPDRPGVLREENRHARRSHVSLEREARTITKRVLTQADPAAWLCLAHHGEVLMRQWRHRPIDGTAQRRFTDADVFDAPVVMHTPPAARAGWW
jgi:hypothetical protein